MAKKNSLPGLLVKVLLVALLLVPVLVPAQKKAKTAKGYGEASYTLTTSGKYMTTWLVAGPVAVSPDGNAPSEDAQMMFFREDVPPVSVAANSPLAPLTLKGKQYPWEIIRTSDDIIDLDNRYSGADFSAAFAMAEIKSESPVNAFLGVGSDDAIRIWHNGKLIHDNWIPRGVERDADLVPIALQAGSNQILLKVQDMQQGWGFVVRLLDKEALSEQLITVAGRGDIDQLKLLLDAGARVEHQNSSGLTALNNAHLGGRDEAARWLIQAGAKETQMPSVEKLVNGLYGSMEGKESSGIAVLVARDGNILYEKGFGYADIQQKKPVTPETKFRIGSITKQFTAAAILRLQEEGKISVQDKLSKFLPDFPRAGEVTIHHLLTHTSGIHSYTGKPEFISRVTSPITEDELIAFFKDDPYDFNPGEKWLYNNSAYFLLGHIIGKVSGKPYGDYLKETFFDPLGMANTGVHKSGLKLDHEAKGYTRENGEYKVALDWDMSWAGGAGALYSTVVDLFKWNEAVFNGRVLKDESLKAALTPVLLNNGAKPDNASYGYGWGINEYRGQQVIEHNGGLHGFISQAARYPEQDVTVVLLTNITPPEVNINSNRIAEFLLWDNLDKQESRSLNASVSEDVSVYAGRYDFGGGMVMTITTQDNNLFAQLSGQQKFPIFPSAEGQYFWKVVEAKIHFVKNGDGVVEYANFEQNGQKLKVMKLKDRPVVSIDKALYKLYAGKYNLGTSMVIIISLEDDKLYAQATNQPRLEIVPVSEEEFIAREVNATLRFVKEPDGKVNKFILDHGGQKQEVVRAQE